MCYKQIAAEHAVVAAVPAGQFGKVGGFIEPLPEDSTTRYEYANEIVGNVIPPEFYPACEKGFREAANAGSLIGAPVEVSVGCLVANLRTCKLAVLLSYCPTVIVLHGSARVCLPGLCDLQSLHWLITHCVPASLPLADPC